MFSAAVDSDFLFACKLALAVFGHRAGRVLLAGGFLRLGRPGGRPAGGMDVRRGPLTSCSPASLLLPYSDTGRGGSCSRAGFSGWAGPAAARLEIWTSRWIWPWWPLTALTTLRVPTWLTS